MVEESIINSFRTLSEYMIHYRPETPESVKQELGALSDDDLKSLIERGNISMDFGGTLRIMYILGDTWSMTADLEGNIYSKEWIVNAPDQITHFIAIFRDKPRIVGKNQVAKHLGKINKIFEYFTIDDLQFNVLKHKLVPMHQRITNTEEIKRIQQSYQLDSPTKFPFILQNDPAARAIGLQPRELVKITRFTENAGEHIFYRYCIPTD
jgi:DNA-directed RNA polymerase subunit H